MYILKNAYRNVVRSRMRSLMLCGCIFAIALSSCIGLSIKNSSDRARDALLSGMEVTASIGIDRTSLMSSNRDDMSNKDDMMSLMQQEMSIEEMFIYSEAPTVASFRYYESLSVSGSDIEPYSSTNNMMPGRGDMGGSDFTLIGYADENSASLFNDSTLIIEEGEYFGDNLNQVLVSYELAYSNELEVGDVISIANPQQDTEISELTISGIFSCLSSDAYVNDIYTNELTIDSILELSSEMESTYINERSGAEVSTILTSRLEGTYVFANVEDYYAFEEDVESFGLDTSIYSVISTDLEEFENMMLPIEQVAEFTMIFLVVILIIGVIILFILTTFSIRERKYEIGVLSAIGMNKVKVAVQFASEMLMITSLSVILAIGVGAISAQPIGNALLSDQIESLTTTTTQPGMMGGMSGGMQGGMSEGMSGGMPNDMSSGLSIGSSVDYVDTLDTSIDTTVLLQLFGLAIVLSALASSVSMISILRYEPLKILSERS